MYAIAADAVLLVHAAFVLFVIVMVPLVYTGGALGWGWVRRYWLRVAHLLGIAIVALQSWAGLVCPLTTLEMWLRRKSGLQAYSGSFIEHWLQRLLYWDLPAWVFIVIYSLFALLVVFTWYLVPPQRRRERSEGAGGVR